MDKYTGPFISFPLDTGATYLVLRDFGGPMSPSFSIVGVGGQPYLPHQTPLLNCIFRGIYFIHFSLDKLPGTSMGKDILARVGASISFAPSTPLLLLASQPPSSNVSFPLPASQVDPKSGTPKAPLLLNTIFPLSSNYRSLPGTLPKLSTLSHSRALGDLSLSSLTF